MVDAPVRLGESMARFAFTANSGRVFGALMDLITVSVREHADLRTAV
jgi:hypothetical protein